jgi:hypothetical protein
MLNNWAHTILWAWDGLSFMVIWSIHDSKPCQRTSL